MDHNSYFIIFIIFVLFCIICLMFYTDGQYNKNELFDDFGNNGEMPSVSDLELIISKGAHEISDMTVNYIITPCMAGGLYQLKDRVDCIIHYKHYYEQVLKDPLSEMFYYLIQLGKSPFTKTHYGHRQLEEHRALSIMTFGYSRALTQVLQHTVDNYNTDGYVPETFKNLLYNSLRHIFKQKMYEVYELNDLNNGTNNSEEKFLPEEHTIIENITEEIHNVPESKYFQYYPEKKINNSSGGGVFNYTLPSTLKVKCHDIESDNIRVFVDDKKLSCI